MNMNSQRLCCFPYSPIFSVFLPSFSLLPPLYTLTLFRKHVLGTHECNHNFGFLGRRILTVFEVRTLASTTSCKFWGFQVEDCCAFDAPRMDTPMKKTVTDSKPLTTFVQADTNTFKDVVQRLTGSSEFAANEMNTAKGNIGVKRPEFKLHERRQYKAKLEIIKPPSSIRQGAAIMHQHLQEQQTYSPSASGHRAHHISPMSTPTKCFSSLSLGEPAAPDLNTQEEEKAIRERRFYLHPSPRSNPGFSEPELLSLFPLTSPKSGEESGD